MIPQEIEYRETDHGYVIDDYAWGENGLNVGEVKHTNEWMTDEKVLEWERELDRKEAARAALGCFGFGRPT